MLSHTHHDMQVISWPALQKEKKKGQGFCWQNLALQSIIWVVLVHKGQRTRKLGLRCVVDAAVGQAHLDSRYRRKRLDS